MLGGMPLPSNLIDLKVQKVKQESGLSGLNSGSKVGFATLMCAKVLELLPNDSSQSFTRKEFVQKYNLCYVNMSPK
jgi:hypothetical protein